MKLRNPQGGAVAGAVALCAVFAPAAAQEALRTEPIVASGHAAPGVMDATFAELDAAWINRSRQVAFWARLDGAALTHLTDQSAWVADGAVLSLVAAAGEAPPAYPGRLVSGIGQIVLGDDGRLSILANLDDDAIQHDLRQAPLFVLFAEEAGGQRSLIAAENALPNATTPPPPDPAARLVNTIVWAAASDDGVLAFDGWTDSGQQLTPWLPGAQVVTVDGINLDVTHSDAPAVGPGGRVVFRAALYESHFDPVNRDLDVQALMLDGPADAAPLLLYTSEPAPYFPSIHFADVAQQIAIGRGGQIAFRGRLRGDPGVSGIWVLADGATAAIVQEGDPLPGAPLDSFGAFAGGPAMNLHGDIAIRAIAEPGDTMQPRRVGLWGFPEADAAWQVALAGQPVPGVADAAYVYFTDPTMSDAGRVVFLAGVAGAGIGDYTQTALVAASRDGGATVLARTGIEMMLNGVASPISSISFAGGRNPDGGRLVASYGAADQIVYEVLLEDGRSALIRATVGHGADYDHNSILDEYDVLAYVNLWLADHVRADIAAPAEVDIFDLLAFLDCWFAGREGADCP